MFELIEGKHRERIENYFYSRFSVGKDFFIDKIFLKKGNYCWMAFKDLIKALSEKNSLNAGILLFLDINNFRLTSLGIRLFEKEIKENIVSLNEIQVKEFLNNKKFELTEKQLTQIKSDGEIALKFEEFVIGVGEKKGNELIPSIARKN
ncbi:MAG TPA: hypothetical protein VJK05_04955 [archaeon]|nr:hypothetical protein [archaeon]